MNRLLSFFVLLVVVYLHTIAYGGTPYYINLCPTSSPVTPTSSPLPPSSSPSRNPTLSPSNPTLSPSNPTLSPSNPTLSPVPPTLSPVVPSPPSSSPVRTGGSVLCNRQGKDQQTCLLNSQNCRWIGRNARRTQYCKRQFGSVEKCMEACGGDFGCHGRPWSQAVDVCDYKCAGLCRLDQACEFLNGKCQAKRIGRRELAPVVCIADNQVNPGCASPCQSGVCECSDCSPNNICLPSIPSGGIPQLTLSDCLGAGRRLTESGDRRRLC